MENDNKKFRGQFFTINNPFVENAFYDWFFSIPEEKRSAIIEPFAGSNNIVKMINNLKIGTFQWFCYDIEPPVENAVSEIKVERRDTIEYFPIIKNAFIAITNPPYLAKNSATRSGMPFKYAEYDDLYKKCLEVMLSNVEYVAAIIPESFITSNLFHKRLHSVISLTCKMFDDTDCPVCLAMFSPNGESPNDDFNIYRQGLYERIGTFKNLDSLSIKSDFNRKNWVFNDPKGNIGILCVDNTKKPSIKFVDGNLINSAEIKVSSRSKTRVSGLPFSVDLNDFLEKCNSVLKEYREITRDVFLTSFKGLRDDGFYRRRLDFDIAKNIMGHVLEEMSND